MLDKAPYARLKIGTISDYKGVADNATVPYGEVNETSTRLACPEYAREHRWGALPAVNVGQGAVPPIGAVARRHPQHTCWFDADMIAT